jgi:hypothetical protein
MGECKGWNSPKQLSVCDRGIVSLAREGGESSDGGRGHPLRPSRYSWGQSKT